MSDLNTERMPVHFIAHNDLIPSDEEWFKLFKRYPELPSHIACKLINRNYTNGRDRLAQLSELGHLIQHAPFIDARKKISKHFSYSLNIKGYKTQKQRPHRVYESLIEASTEIGVRETSGFEYLSFYDLALLPSMKGRRALELLDAGDNPHHIPLREGFFIPDGNGPTCIYHDESKKHINIITEADRATEPMTSAKKRRNIEEKFENYHAFFERDPETKERGYTKHYGLQQCYIRWVTTDEANRQAMMRLWEKKYGPSKHMLFATWPDWFYARSYPPADGQMFEIAYERVGYPALHLNNVSEW